MNLDFNDPDFGDEQNQDLIQSIVELMKATPEHLERIRDYTGCEEPIRKALNDPSPSTESTAWKAVSASVVALKSFYDFSLELERLWVKILPCLCTDEPINAIQSHISLTYQVSRIFEFAFRFDEFKMINPAIQNDFSYYRRVLGRNKGEPTVVNDELANKMSLFYAYPTPMLKGIISWTCSMEIPGLTNLSKERGLSLIANLCLKSLENGQGGMLALCSMTGCIILVDHLNENGVFHKKSSVRIRNCIEKLREQNPPVDFLLNALRFTTLHLNDEDTMPVITRLLTY
uniref:CYRIA/CYRIB Rac1 binding domain-containing protein n=1 Tax=Arcella intermedia TaxID=1963864 RepID=A0A6B2LBS7_9EUKA